MCTYTPLKIYLFLNFMLLKTLYEINRFLFGGRLCLTNIVLFHSSKQ